jgi:hypothetical protein
MRDGPAAGTNGGMNRIPTLATALATLAFASCARSDTPPAQRAAAAAPANQAAAEAALAGGRPTIDPGMNPSPMTLLRAQYATMLDPPGRKMPADAAQLDAMLAAGQHTALYARLTGPLPPAQLLLDINWEQARLFNGASVLVTFAAINDEWRYAPSASPGKQVLAQQAALVLGLYARAQLETEMLGCGTPLVIGRREQELGAQFAPMWAAGRALPRATQLQLVETAMELETATRPVRRDDVVACDWGPTKQVDPGPTAGIGADLPADGATYPFGAHDTMGDERVDPYAHLQSDLVGQISPTVGPQ